MILSLDLGTSATKAIVWDGARVVAAGRAELRTDHPQPGRAEQDPEAWWASVVTACAAARGDAPDAWNAIRAVSFAAARETFAAFDAALRPLGPGILWSDARAADEADGLGDPIAFRRRSGVVLNAACCAAKIAWLEVNDSERFERARWLLSPRDWVLARLTGGIFTDETLASRTGLYRLDGAVAAPGEVATRLPPVVPSTTRLAVGESEHTATLGLTTETVVVVGGGDRACEVLGVDATPQTPMVSWGTTTNVSVPASDDPGVAAVSRGARGGLVVEAGLSTSGAALGWLAELTGRSHDELLEGAASVPVGASGVLALPWLHGARAPWWRPDARAAFVGMTGAHGPFELARAVVEAVALDVARCVELVAPGADTVALAGGGAANPLWRDVVAACARRPALRRRHDEAASVGARMLVDWARGQDVSVDAVNPVVSRVDPDPDLVEQYRAVRAASDDTAAALLGLPAGTMPGRGTASTTPDSGVDPREPR